MLFGLHGKPLFASFREPFRNSPTLENSLSFQPEVIVEPPSVMFLNNKNSPFLLFSVPIGGFWAHCEVPFRDVFPKATLPTLICIALGRALVSSKAAKPG